MHIPLLAAASSAATALPSATVSNSYLAIANFISSHSHEFCNAHPAVLLLIASVFSAVSPLSPMLLALQRRLLCAYTMKMSHSSSRLEAAPGGHCGPCGPGSLAAACTAKARMPPTSISRTPARIGSSTRTQHRRCVQPAGRSARGLLRQLCVTRGNE